jgi:hypothetical protein
MTRRHYGIRRIKKIPEKGANEERNGIQLECASAPYFIGQ